MPTLPYTQPAPSYHQLQHAQPGSTLHTTKPASNFQTHSCLFGKIRARSSRAHARARFTGP
eukprot:528860-Pleurochrysis_carterae.AAC.3